MVLLNEHIVIVWQVCQKLVAAILFRVEAAVRLGLSNPACTAKPCEWLPNRKVVKPLKIKDMELSRVDFRKREKKVNTCTSIKKCFNPLESNIKPFELTSTCCDVCNQTM